MAQYANLLKGVVETVKIEGNQMNSADLTRLTKTAMESVEGEPLLGYEKKDLALKLMSGAVEHFKNTGNLNEGSAEMIQLAIGTFGGAAIDLAVLATKKLVEINQKIASNCKARCRAKKEKK